MRKWSILVLILIGKDRRRGSSAWIVIMIVSVIEMLHLMLLDVIRLRIVLWR